MTAMNNVNAAVKVQSEAPSSIIWMYADIICSRYDLQKKKMNECGSESPE
jgi:hypothetical protein